MILESDFGEISQGYLFTPYVGENRLEKIRMSIGERDLLKWQRAYRKDKESWQINITDELTGKRYLIQAADCGRGCFCAAEIVREL